MNIEIIDKNDSNGVRTIISGQSEDNKESEWEHIVAATK